MFALMCFASRLRTPRFSRWIKDEDWQQFKSDGYMVIRDVIPRSLTTKAVLDIAAFVGADIRDSTTWYRGPIENDGMVACITPSRFGISDSIRHFIRYSVNTTVRTS